MEGDGGATLNEEAARWVDSGVDRGCGTGAWKQRHGVQ
jgi:hypothetical protein